MVFEDLELIFNRALKFSFSKKKLLFMFPVLVVCGLMLVFCRALAVNAGQWVINGITQTTFIPNPDVFYHFLFKFPATTAPS